jgi:MFS family permease
MRPLIPIFVSSFFISINIGALLFVNSSQLSKFFEPNIVSAIFLLGALTNIILFLLAPKLIERIGKLSLLIYSLILTTTSTLGLALATNTLIIALSFIIYSSLIYIILYLLDIFLEENSLNIKTGSLRGAYITYFHIGFILGLWILSFFTTKDAFTIVYLIAGVLLIPPILLATFYFQSSLATKHHLSRSHEFKLFAAWWKVKSIRRITLTRMALECFYSFMVIYTPLYLHNYLGFEWHVLGVMFMIMLLPFTVLEWPIGILADHFIGEKEFLIIGFLIIGTTLLIMPQAGASFMVWTTLLFLSRVGACCIEITTDSYLFKHINAQDIGLISMFRVTKPISIILGTILGALTINLFSFEKIFYVAAIVIFFGLKESLLLRDTL